MKVDVISLENKSVGKIDLNDEIYGQEIRKDILHRVVNWQLAKRRSGNHKTKTVSEVSGTTKKPFSQKGTGRARAGTRRAVQHVGGAVAFGPVVRSHATKLTKKFKKLGLKIALSSKLKDEALTIIDELKLDSPKTKEFKEIAKNLSLDNALIIDGNDIDGNAKLAVSNIIGIDVLPAQGANVYDILRADKLLLTKNAVEQLEARLK